MALVVCICTRFPKSARQYLAPYSSHEVSSSPAPPRFHPLTLENCKFFLLTDKLYLIANCLLVLLVVVLLFFKVGIDSIILIILLLFTTVLASLLRAVDSLANLGTG